MLAGSANALGERAGACSCDVHKMRIAADLIEHGQQSLRLGKKPVVHIGLELTKGVIDTEAVVLDGAFEQGEVALLAGKTFEDLHEHGGGRVQSVIESRLMHFRAALVAKSFLPEV